MAIMVENVRPRGGHLFHEDLTAPVHLSILEVKDKVGTPINCLHVVSYGHRTG